MVQIGSKTSIAQLFIGNTTVAALYRGAKLIYTSVRACFAGKRWRYDKPWFYKDSWRY